MGSSSTSPAGCLQECGEELVREYDQAVVPDGGVAGPSISLITPPAENPGTYSGEVDGEPDRATVVSILAGADRTWATRADLREVALEKLTAGETASSVAAWLDEPLGQVRAWWRWHNGGDR